MSNEKRMILFRCVTAGIIAAFAAVILALTATAACAASAPEQKDGIYQIGTPQELCWFADLVNGELKDGTAQKSSAQAVLTADIDLSGMKYTPIGRDLDNTFKGTFDGQKHQISGLVLKENGKILGLFGVLNAAQIRNVTVSGEIRGDSYAIGGIAGKSSGKTTITCCGNLASVNGTGSSSNTGGILGTSDDGITIKDCFNRGAVTSAHRASGITPEMSFGTLENCYNTASISGNIAAGVGNARSNTYKNCYNAGKITGSQTAVSIGSSKYATYENCYYRAGMAAGDTEELGKPKPASDMKKAAFAETLGKEHWQTDRGARVNGGYPLLAWETPENVGNITLETPGGLKWNIGEPDSDKYDFVTRSVKACWTAVDGASGYTLRVYTADDRSRALIEKSGIENTEYDLTKALGGMKSSGRRNYVFTVTAEGDGSIYQDSEESQASGDAYEFDPATYVDCPGELVWNRASRIAEWKAVKSADFYIVTLYEDGKKKVEFTIGRELLDKDSEKLSMHFLSSMAADGDYYFTVRAGFTIDDSGSEYDGKTCVSALSRSESGHFDAEASETVEISSVDDWMKIVNTTAKGTGYQTDADAQNAAWSRNYKLTADIDFSRLTAEQQNQEKSWGNINAMFNGTFDGNGHKITGLTLSNGDGGLFRYIGTAGEVKNVVVENPNVLFSDNAAVMCYYNYGSMENCTVRNANITADTGAIIGGMVSRNFGTIEKSCVQGGSLTANSQTANGHAGFVGNNFGVIRQCWTSMDVHTQSYCAGGFAGWTDSSGGRTGSFEDCFALGSVTATRGWSGGFVGRINSGGVTFKNCYAANRVSSADRPERAYGFAGSMSGEAAKDIVGSSGFDEEIPAENSRNCYFATDLTASDNPKGGAKGVSLDAMRTAGFAATMGDSWTRADGRNSGLPYLTDVAAPTDQITKDITVKLAIALYDKSQYDFVQDGKTLSVTLSSTGNTRLIDVMNAAQKQGLLTYDYTVSPDYGSFIESINGNRMLPPNGWMFTVNDEISIVSATLASIHEGDCILWYQGTMQNLFKAPAWADITDEKPAKKVIPISTVAELVALCDDNADLTANYRLTRDIDLSGTDFRGIGSKTHPFSGSFDGAGHTVSNMTIHKPEANNVGFFNFIRGATVKNVVLRNADVTGKYSVGALVGVAAVTVSTVDIASNVGNTIGNCRVYGRVTSTNTDLSGSSSGSYTGGLIGFNDGDSDAKTGLSILSSVDSCIADVNVTAGAIYAGGLAGGNFGYITDSKARGNVSGASCTGGFVGGNNGKIYDCSATGDVIGKKSTGGFVGNNYDTTMRSYCTGSVNGDGEGLGGFAGSGSGVIKKCASAGTLTATSGSSYRGGFIGHYQGTLAGLKKDITFSENYGWSMAPDGGEYNVVGSKTKGNSDAEQAALDTAKITDWPTLQKIFLELYDVRLGDHGGIDDPAGTVIDKDKLADAIYRNMTADHSTDDLSCWKIGDIAVYEKLTGRKGGVTDEQRQAFIDQAASHAQKSDVSAIVLAKDILGLTAMGADPRKVVLAGESSDTALNLVSVLKNRVSIEGFGELSIYTQPYVLLALSQNKKDLTAAERDSMIGTIIVRQRSNGGFGGADADGPVIMALAMWREESDAAREAIQKAISREYVTSMMDDNGAVSYNGTASAESTAQMIVGICAAGGDPEHYVRGDCSLTDGLLSFVNDSHDGFVHKDGNPQIATEQGFRGLLSCRLVKRGSILYDFRETRLNPAVSGVKRDGSAPDTKPDSGETGGGDTTLTAPSVRAENSGKGVLLTWKKVSKASEYQILKRSGASGTWKVIKTVKPDTIRWADRKVKNGEICLYRVRVLSEGKKATSPIIRIVRLTGTRITKAVRAEKRTVSLRWKKNGKGSGYQIRYAFSEKFQKSRNVTVKGKKNARWTLRHLKKGRIYVQVRSYKKKDGKKYYSVWSKTKKISVR